MSYLEGCTAPMRDENQLHAAIVEIVVKDNRPLVGAGVQELFHSPARGSFHLSLTVLVHYRSHGSI